MNDHLLPTNFLPVLLLFRHGQTEYNATRRFQGQQDIPLNDTGRKQANQTAEIVANILSTFLRQGAQSSVVEKFVSSDLSRATETAKTVAQCLHQRIGFDVPLEYEKDLREYDCGDLANYTVDEFSEKFPGVVEKYFTAYETDKYHAKFPGETGESRAGVFARVSRHLQKLNLLVTENLPAQQDLAAAKTRFFVWSTHGGIIDALLELTNNTLSLETKPVGNGDVLVLYPACRYTETGVNGNSDGTTAPSRIVRDLGCNVGWKLWRHYKVGDAVSARIVR